MRNGSINRAKNAVFLSGAADIGMGVEFGYIEDELRVKMICYAFIAERDGNIYSEHSSAFELPTAMVEALENDYWTGWPASQRQRYRS